MTIQPGAMLYTQSFGSRPESVEVPHYAARVPTAMDWNYPIGKLWIWQANSIWMLLNVVGQLGVNTATWVQLSDANGGILSVLGTANQITATDAAGVITLTTPAAFIAPGSIAATTTLTATLGAITATNGNLSLATAGNKLLIATGANASVGVSAALDGASPSQLVVATTAVTASSLI